MTVRSSSAENVRAESPAEAAPRAGGLVVSCGIEGRWLLGLLHEKCNKHH